MTLNQYTQAELGNEQDLLTRYIASQVFSRASGRGIPICTQNHPRDVYFVGNLRPVPSDEGDQFVAGRSSELINKLAPVAFGLEFRLIPDNQAPGIKVRVLLSWNCYYRVFPTYSEQRAHQFQQDVVESDTANDGASAEPPPDAEQETDDDRVPADTSQDVLDSAFDRRKKRRARTDTLFVKFKQIRCSAEGSVYLKIEGVGQRDWTVDLHELNDVVEKEIERARQIVLNDPDALRVNKDVSDNLRVPDQALDSEDQYAKYLATLLTPIVPIWAWSIDVSLRDGSGSLQDRLVYIEFTNVSPIDEMARNLEGFFFDVHASLAFTGSDTVPLEFDLAPRGFRYDPTLIARGFNCNVSRAPEDSDYHLVTESMPIFVQRRYQTQTRPPASFRDLAEDPIPALIRIRDAMYEYRDTVWAQDARQYGKEPWWGEEYQREFARDKGQFEDEIIRFERGINILQSSEDVRKAFQLTNETFARGPKQSWRLFQIVFLVSQIPGITALVDSESADTQERSVVDIIYFPTGGGKTEVYLSVIVFHCFFDRLRGKKAGVTAWTRFPLRLLTLQQTQRVADVIGMADIVRREQSDPRLTDCAPFGVGYFVGASATPNKLNPPYKDSYADPEWEIARDPQERQRWKRIITCPSCGTSSVRVDFDEDTVRLYHRCTNSKCKFEGGIIPVYVVDHEIYRYLPSVIVGTIDKLAGIGNQKRMAMLFGRVDGICPDHGYFVDKCDLTSCKDKKKKSIPARHGLSGPTLFVQDELHLLKEGLGTFDAHYETFTQELLREFGSDLPLKIIASSATIEAFERQVEHLYGRQVPQEARVFPGLGPRLEYSFYAETLSYPQRMFVGVIPHNKTIFNSILELIQYYHEIIQELGSLSSGSTNPYGGRLEPGTPDWREVIDLYKTSLTYFLNTRELHSIKTDLEGAVNPELEDQGYHPLLISELTGSVSTSDVAITLERLERKVIENIPDTVLATNMVSHGVDVDYLNSMIFYGMPPRVAEYIQASSRVGRRHVGLVFMCMHPARERDQSHYTYFSKFHEYLGQLIEPVAINRWSRFSITRTLPGLFMSMLIQMISRRFEESGGRFTRLDYVKQQIRDGKITQDDFIQFLERAYLLDGKSAIREEAFREDIHNVVGRFFDQILGAGPHVEWVSEALIPPPMRSLREVDEQLEVELDDNGSSWANRR